MPGMTQQHAKAGIWLPLFDELAEPHTCTELAREAEATGWDGVFVWDHLQWRPPVRSAADPWIVMAAIAATTTRVRIGPLVTPLPRRRPAKVARETVTLDRLSDGRLVLGVGIGHDRFGAEFSAFGEVADDRMRADMLDESLAILTAAWTGQTVRHDGTHHRVDDVRFLPRPVQPTIPIWVAGTAGRRRPLERAVRHDGFMPVSLTGPDQVAEVSHAIREQRDPDVAGPFDLIVPVPAGTDPAPYVSAGATWWMPELDPEHLSVPDVLAVIRNGR